MVLQFGTNFHSCTVERNSGCKTMYQDHLKSDISWCLQLLRLSDISNQLLTFFYESINSLTPNRLHGLIFSLRSTMHKFTTKQSSQGDFYLTRKNTLQNALVSIQYLEVKQRNELPRGIRNSSFNIYQIIADLNTG